MAYTKEKRREYDRQYALLHPEEVKAKKRRYRESHREKLREKSRADNLSNFMLTKEDYDAKLKSQGGACAICGGGPGSGLKRFSIDHNHRTGVVRGLLCRLCNSLLGFARERIDVLSESISYLNKYGDELESTRS